MRALPFQPFFPLAAAFLALCLIVTQDGGQNARSRLLAMRSFVEDGNFRLDEHLKSTDDWAQAPNGHYYSNKAPGAIFLGLPVFFVADNLHRVVEKKRFEGEVRPNPEYMQSTVTSFLVQALPAALLVLAIAAWLSSVGVSPGGQLFFVLGVLFANTASLFYNNFFGHGLSAVLQLAALYSLLRRRFGWAGGMFSLALLSDYGFAPQIPALLLSLLLIRPNLDEAKKFVLASLPAGLAWSLYHGLIFGSPFAVASQFQNPTFLELEVGHERLWGMIAKPDLSIFWELVVGPSRGLVVGQPWALFLVVWLLFLLVARRKSSVEHGLSVAAAFTIVSIAGLLLFNSSYNGWHAGATAGPRYLSAVLPCFALAGALAWDPSPRWTRWVLALLLFVALVFRALVYGSTILAPLTPLWDFFWAELIQRSTTKVRAAVFVLLVGLATYRSWRRLKNLVVP